MFSYAYERVSTLSQSLDRQDIAIKQFRPDIEEVNIFRDKATGKDFDREQYKAMKIILEHVSKANQTGEIIEVIVEELDRLGRNAEGIKKELEWFKEHGICVRILEIPTTLIEVQEENRWVIELINNILIEVYSSMAQAEIEKRSKRQAEGVEAALAKGIKFGRPAIAIDKGAFEKIYKEWKQGNITAVEAQRRLGIKANTFYRRVANYEKGGQA